MRRGHTDYARSPACSHFGPGIFDLYSGPAAGQLRDNWLAQALKTLKADAALSAQIPARQLLAGVEGLLRTQTGDMTGFVSEVRGGISSNTDDPSMDLSCLALLAESFNLAERWRDALGLLDGVELDARADISAIERFHWAKGVALRYLGKIRDAQHELRLVFRRSSTPTVSRRLSIVQPCRNNARMR